MHDKGGALGALPVAQELLKRQYDVRIIAHPESPAASLLRQHQVSFDPVRSVQDALGLRRYDCPEVMIVALDPTPYIPRDVSAFYRAKGQTVIALSDFPNRGGIRRAWLEDRFRPHRVVVNDAIGAQILCEMWPDYSPDHIWTTGFPALDRLSTIDVQNTSREVRSVLKIPSELPIVLFGDPAEGGALAFREVVQAANKLGRHICLIARIRPTTPKELPEEMPLYEAACKEFKSGQLIRDSSVIQDTLQLIAAAAVTISTYSTILQEAAALHLPNIAVLDKHQMPIFRHFIQARELHLVSLKCTAKASDNEELTTLLESALLGQLHLPGQVEHFRLDGKNTSRAVDCILSFINT